jgi:multicomponent Na+:H+ antiporter subunit D
MREIFSSLLAWNGTTLLMAALALPLITSLLVLVSGSRPNLRETISMVCGMALFAIIAFLARHHFQEGPATWEWLQVIPGFSLAFETETSGLVFALIASFLWPVTTLYAVGYLRGNHEENQTRFFACFGIAILSAMGIALSQNLFTLFIFYELMTLSTYPLVAHAGNEAAKRGGRTYIGLLMGTSIGLQLPAMIMILQLTGTLDFAPEGILAGKASGTVTAILLLLYAYGVGKAALMPLHRWLPAAMVAPTPVSALLHAVAVVKAGVFSLYKIIVFVFGTDNLIQLMSENFWHGQWLTWIAGITILLASLVALRQDNLKRRLAYSTISQLSYVVMAASLLAPYALLGALLHIIAHAFGKITLFFAAGSIYTAAHKKDISQLKGIGRQMPVTMTAFTLGALVMIGLPPTVGFLSKWYILLGALQADQWFAVGVLIASTVLNAAYFLPIIYVAFFHAPEESTKEDEHHHGRFEAPLPIVIALCITAAMTVVLTVFSAPIVSLLVPSAP